MGNANEHTKANHEEIMHECFVLKREPGLKITRGGIHNTRFTSKTAPKVVEICITTTQLFNRNSLSVCNGRRRPDISRSLSAPCEKGENLTVSTIRQLESCGVLLQEDVKTQTTVLDSRNRKNWTNRTIADLLP